MEVSQADPSALYPLSTQRDILDSHDLTMCDAALTRDAGRLFVGESSRSHVEIREYSENIGQNVTTSSGDTDGSRFKLGSSRLLTTEHDVDDLVSRTLPRRGIRIITIHRTNSWSRMKITLAAFKKLCSHHKIDPHILPLVASMGFKSSPNDEHFMRFHSHLRPEHNTSEALDAESEPGRSNRVSAFGVCYNIRHFEKHDRDLEDPWSCRQSVLAQEFHIADRSSTWLIVQPPLKWASTLDDVTVDPDIHPLALHLRYIVATTSNTREYLSDTDNILSNLDQRVSFPKPLADFDFDFSLSQRVQSQRRKIHHVKTIVDGALQTLSSLLTLAEQICIPAEVSVLQHDAFEREVACVSGELKNYKATAEELLSVACDINATINSILQFRNQELLQQNAAQLQRIAENEAQETRHMAEIAKWTYDDSRSMRIATVIALVYLPANLVMGFFSTIFTDFSIASGSGPGSSSVRLQIYGQVWVALLSILVLITCTWLTFWFWDRRRRNPTPAQGD